MSLSLCFFLIKGSFASKLVTGMKGAERLTKPAQYTLVYSKGQSWANSFLVMKVLPNGRRRTRYGLSVSKRVGKAVTRNRVKRLLREILRLTPLESGWDIVFIARPAIATINYTELKKSVGKMLSQARLLVRNYEEIPINTN